jgi:predicted HTH transcriptional regulator
LVVELGTYTLDPLQDHYKTVAGFMNSEGGTLLIGVADDGSIVGLDNDYATMQKPNSDGFELFLTQLFENSLSGTARTLARVNFDSIDGKDVCRVGVAASARPVFTRPVDGKDPAEFWARIGNSTGQLVGTDMDEYRQDHWS